MTVDAIRLLQEAEVQADQKMQEAEQLKKQLKEESKARVSAFQEELRRTEYQAQLEIQKQLEDELITSKEPLLAETKKEIEKLRSVPQSLKEQALEIIINKVVT